MYSLYIFQSEIEKIFEDNKGGLNTTLKLMNCLEILLYKAIPEHVRKIVEDPWSEEFMDLPLCQAVALQNTSILKMLLDAKFVPSESK